MNRTPFRSLCVCVLVLLVAACGDRKFEPQPRPSVDGGSTNNASSVGNLGDPCAGDGDCAEGLVCGSESQVCEAAGNVAEGSPCTRTGDCADGLYCEQSSSLCSPAGDGVVGAPCAETASCEAGLVCAPRGFSGACAAPGENDLGEECSGFTDCVAGLGCAPPITDPTAPPVCQTGLAGLPLWQGVECADDEMGNFRPYFEVPDGEVSEFYRLPYPNDIRIADGRPDLTGHPTPGAALLGFDVTQRYIDAIEAEQDRFGLNSWVFMRFSERVDFDSISPGGDTASIFSTVLSPEHPSYGRRVSMKWKAHTSGGRYICQNWLAARPGRAWGRPLDPDTTYAVVLTNSIKSAGGVPAAQDDDFAAMLASTRPAGALGDAWDAYQPLRDWITESGTDPSTIASAAVFTTGNPVADAEELAAPARAEVPVASELTACEEATLSPCDDGLENDEHVRGCFGTSPDFHEIHGKLSLPIFQQGDAPYLESGGAAANVVQRREDVCIGMTVPKATMPAQGWPVLVYAHGTNGNFRGHVANGTAAIVNEIDANGDTVQFLTLGWDQVQHFTRRNGDETHPNELVFNYANPPAAKGNFLQAAAETHAVIAYVESLNIAAADSPIGEEIRVDPTKIYFMGHSQGGTSGPLALPFAPAVQGAVLSGAGAGLTLAILEKTSPVNSPRALQVALLESKPPSETHPVINLIQAYFDPVDPVVFGHLLAAEIAEGRTTPKHVFHTNATTDTYSPPAGLDAMARALRSTYILPIPVPIEGVPTADAPFGGNITHDAAAYTSVGRQYEPDADYDGHFVIFRHPTAQGDLAEFLGSAVSLGVPEIQ